MLRAPLSERFTLFEKGCKRQRQKVRTCEVRFPTPWFCMIAELRRTPSMRSSSAKLKAPSRRPRTSGTGKRKAGLLWEGKIQRAPGLTIVQIVISRDVKTHTQNG